MFDEQVETDEAAATPDETAAGVDGVSADAADSEVADLVDQQAATSTGAAAEAAPEVPDDAGDTIARAQQHIESLNMDKEREAAKRVM